MEKLTITTRVFGGKIPDDIRLVIAKKLQSVDDDTRIKIEIYEPKDTRSIQQNKRQWAIYTLIAKDTGHTPQDIHDFYRREYLKTEKVDKITGEVYPYIKSTTELNTEEHAQYTELIELHAQEFFNCKLPEINTEP
jgi:hypothetical protein